MKKKDITPEIIEKVKEVYKTTNSIRKTREQLAETYNLTFHNVRDIIQGTIEEYQNKLEEHKEELKELDKEVKKKPSYEIKDNYYIFYIQETDNYGNKSYKEVPIHLNVIDALYYDYSEFGNNLSTVQILQKYNISDKVFKVIQNRLGLRKKSHIVSEETLNRIPEEEREEFIKNKIAEAIKDKYKNSFVKQYEQQKNRQYNKMARLLSSQEAFLENMQKYIENYEPKKFDFNVEKIDNNDEIAVLFSDLHIGKMETDKVLERIRKMGMDLVKRPERKVNLVCLGDLFENITTEGMHPGQLQSMDYTDPYKIVMDTVSILEQLIMKLIQQGKEVIFSGIGGNHNRLTANSDGDQERIAGLLTYELIKRGLKDTETKFNILKEGWNKLDMMGYNVILHHGDKGAIKKNTSQILWELGDKSKHNIIAMGHVHHFEGADLTDNATKIIVPAMAGANVYDKSLLLSSYTGYVIIEKDEDGTPIQIVRRFNF